MSTLMDEDIKRWTAKRKLALVVEIFQGKTTVAEASRSYDLPPSEIVSKLCRWFDVPRRTFYYKPTKSARTVQDRFADPIKAMIEENPSIGFRTVA